MLIHFKLVEQWLLEATAPTVCVGCGRYGSWLCWDCTEQIVVIREQRCVGCHVLAMDGKTCANCRKRGWAIDGVVAVADFSQPMMREVIHTLKYEGLTAVAADMGTWMGRLVSALAGQDWVVVPVPMHWWREWQRGFNQSTILARAVAKSMGIASIPVLIKTRPTMSQVGLGRARRLANLEGAFVCRQDLTGARVLLVDDVATTGTTLNQAAKALKAAGAKEVRGVVFGRG